MECFFVVLLIVNVILTVVYAIKKSAAGEEAGVALFFLFLPGLGFVIYFLPLLIRHLFGAAAYDRESLIHRNSMARMEEHPHIEEELNVVPVEDAMAVGENREKRTLLLQQMKKGINENYSPLLAAEKDEDSESVHYVAATKMEVHQLLQQEWIDCGRAYKEDDRNAEKCQALLHILRKMIESQVLSGNEKAMYQKKYCALMQKHVNDEDLLLNQDYEAWLAYLVDSGAFEEAEQLWNEKRNRLRSESAYMKMTEMYYHCRKKDKFDNCLSELQKDKSVSLSAEGLEKLRYWIRKG